MIKVSLILSTYNGSRYLKELLESVNSQAYHKFDLVISDDCSSDDTVAILDSFIFRDGITCNRIVNDRNLNWMYNFSKMICSVDADLYILVDQDDLLYKNKVGSIVNSTVSRGLQAETPFMLVHQVDVIDDFGHKLSENVFLGYPSLSYYLDNISILTGGIFGCTTCVSKGLVNIFRNYQRFASIGHDYLLTLLAYKYGAIYEINEVLLSWRRHDNNSSVAKTDIIGTLKVADYILKVCKAKSYILGGTFFHYASTFVFQIFVKRLKAAKFI